MPTLSDADIDRIGRGVLSCTLPKPEWTHAAHFAAALWVLEHPGMDTVCDMPGLIRAYNVATGVANTDTTGYHETITLASLACADAWRLGRTSEPLSAVLASLLASPYGRSDWLLAHWSRERLFSPPARRAWMEPDVAPLPFAVAPKGGAYRTPAAG